MPKGPYKLKLQKLEWLSSVDAPAQGDGARALLIKRKGEQDEIQFTAQVSKLNEELGLVFGHAFSASLDGGITPHVDYQEDAIDQDFIKAAMEFMEAGGPTDVNHDCASDGRVVFAWPLVPEVNEALGIKSDVIGLAVAVKPSPETFQAFKRGELAGFSLYGTGFRTPLGKKHRDPVVLKNAPARVAKAQLYTDEQLGHQHKVCVYDDGSLYVEYATMEGAEYGHSHGIVFENGALVILADSGHTHELAEGQPGIAVVPADAIVVVQARAPLSTRMPGVADGNLANKLAARELAAAKSTRSTQASEADPMKIVILSEAQKALYDTLDAAGGEAFLAKSFAERDAEVEKARAADPVVFKGELTGIEVRKSQGDFAKKLAETAEQNAKTAQLHADVVAKQAAAIEKANIRKQAADVLGGMPGADDTHDLIIGSLLKSGAKQEEIDAAIATLKGMKATSTVGKAAPGVNPGSDPQPAGSDDAFEALTAGLEQFVTEKNIPVAKAWTDGLAAFVQTEKGAALKRAYDEAR